MKYKLIIVILVMLVGVMSVKAQTLSQSEPPPTSMMRNPAAVYCAEVMGYEHRVVTALDGAQVGECILPEGKICDEWDFYAGVCGQKYSYCAREGYQVEPRNDGKDPFSSQYAICVTASRERIGSVTELSNLAERVSAVPSSSIEPISNTVTLEPSIHIRQEENFPLIAPSSFDWRDYQDHNWLTKVKNQGQCGSCWAFAAAGVVEAHHNIIFSDPGLDLNLAEQDLVSCGGVGSCDGGSTIQALRYISETGIVDESCFPYRESDVSCNKCSDWLSRLTFIDNFASFRPDRDSIRERVVNYGPIYVSMGIGLDYGGGFDSDSIYHCSDDSGTNHAVVIVGYDDDADYWIVRNSWGSSWNGDGYFKVGYGECDIDSAYAGYVYVVPPITSYELTGSKTGGWFTSDVIVTFTANEPIVWTKYRIDGGEWHVYSPSLAIDTDGTHLVEYYSRDRFASEETVKSFTVKIDRTAPSNPTSVESGCSAQNNVWQCECTDPAFTWTGADDHGGSGVQDYHGYWGTDPAGVPTFWRTTPTYDPGIIATGDGVITYYLRIATRDVLGHESLPTTVFTLLYDSVSPTGNPIVNQGAQTVYQVDVVVNPNAQDRGSGVAQVNFSNDGTHWQAYPAASSIIWSLEPHNRTLHTIRMQLDDEVGNRSATYVRQVCLDVYPAHPASVSYRLWSAGPTAAGGHSTSVSNYSPAPHSASYRLCRTAISAGGSTALTSASYKLGATVGQVGGNGATSANYAHQVGFWANLDACQPITFTSTYQLNHTIGQTAAGQHLTSASYQVRSGFQAMWPAQPDVEMFTTFTCSTVCQYPLTDVDIQPPSGSPLYVNALYTFAAILTPVDATWPITYTWSPTPQSGQGTDYVTYQWPTIGVKTITLQVENCGGLLTVQRNVTVYQREGNLIYLPLILRNYTSNTNPNHPPYAPHNPVPINGAPAESVTVDLGWAGGDPDGNAVTYDVYLEAGDGTPDVLVSDNQPGTTYDPGALVASTHYYWQIIATDSQGATTAGPVWDFTTVTSPPPDNFLTPFDANKSDLGGPSSWATNYGKTPEIIVASNGVELDVLAQDYNTDTPWNAVLLHIVPNVSGYEITQVLTDTPMLDRVMGLANDDAGNRYYATGVDESAIVDPTYPPLDTYRSNIVRVIKLNAAGAVQFNVDLDIARHGYDSNAEMIINPMTFASSRLAVGGNEIALVHSINTDPDWNIGGRRHQKALSTRLDATSGAVTRVSSVWVSHSFDQRLLYDGTGIIEHHLGDAYPRYLVFGRAHTSYPLFRIKGDIGENNTRTRLGNIALIENDPDYAYIALFATENNANTGATINGPRNLAIVRVKDADNSLDPNLPDTLTITSSGTQYTNRLRWLIHYTTDSNLHAERPKLIGIGGDQYIVLWEQWLHTGEYTDTFSGVYGMVIDAHGIIIQAATLLTNGHHLHRGDDAFYLDNRAAWMTGNAATQQLYIHFVDSALNYEMVTVD